MRTLRPMIVAAVTSAATGLIGTPADVDGNWERVLTNEPKARSHHQMVYDAGRDEMIVFGGRTKKGTRESFAPGTWAWDGTTWTKLSTTESPPRRERHMMAYDPVRDEIVLFGGARGHSRNDTWVFADGEWERRSPATSPPPTSSASIAFDPHLQQVLMFGGVRVTDGLTRVSKQTWTWNGETWLKLDPETKPQFRQEADLAYHPSRARLILFGGKKYGSSDRNDTWSWDGATWIEESPATSPPRRSEFSMATFGDHVALFGGRTDLEYARSTWVLADDGWHKVTTHPVPAKRIWSQLEWDPERNEAVLFGGSIPRSDGDIYHRDTWTLTPSG